MKKILAIAWKDLLIEFRGKENLFACLFFAFVVIIIFNFAFSLITIERTLLYEISAGILWVSFAFTGVLSLNRSFLLEKENQCLSGLRMAPLPGGSLYLGKLLANLVFMVLIEIVMLPFFAALFHVSLLDKLPQLFGIIILGTLGFASVGILFSAISTATRTREVMMPLLLFPVTVPVFLSAVKATGAVLKGQVGTEFYSWFKVLLGFDMIFITVCFFLIEFILEE